MTVETTAGAGHVHEATAVHGVGFVDGATVLLLNPKAYYIIGLLFTQFLLPAGDRIEQVLATAAAPRAPASLGATRLGRLREHRPNRAAAELRVALGQVTRDARPSLHAASGQSSSSAASTIACACGAPKP